MICALVLVLLHAIACNCFSFIPSNEIAEMMKADEEKTGCYLRVKVMCSRDVDLQVMLGAGDLFTDSVFADGSGETIKCLRVPCSADGKVAGEVTIIGNGIITRPSDLKDTKAYSSEDECLSQQTDHFKVTCEGEEIVEEKVAEKEMPANLQGWQNELDQHLKVECPNQHGIYRVKSEHDNGAEDRRWEFFCRRSAQQDFDDQYWSGYYNGFDEPLLHMCGQNYILCGIESYHDNGPEDRRWSLKCCHSPNHYTRNCGLSDYVNWFDHWMDYTTPHSTVFTSTLSYHENWAEDRRWKFGFCDYKYCVGV